MVSPEHGARGRLLTAAAPRFRRFGFRGTSVEDITTAAGTGKGSLYLHYNSKQALYLEVVRLEVEAFVSAATDAMDGADSAPGKLRVLVGSAVTHYGNDDLLSAPLLDDRVLLDADAAALARQLQRARITQLIATTLGDGQRDGTVRADLNPETTAAVLFEIGWAIVRSHLTGELALPLAEALTTLNDLLGKGTTNRSDH